MDGPVFRGYVKWNDEDGPNGSPIYKLDDWLLERLPHRIIVPNNVSLDLRDVGDSVLEKWSAYHNIEDGRGYYFFETETDAMAFKLRWV